MSQSYDAKLSGASESSGAKNRDQIKAIVDGR
jgi:hypothetical protein